MKKWIVALVSVLLLACSTPQDNAKKNDAPPVIEKITAQPAVLTLNGKSMIKCRARDADRDPLQYQWYSSLGTILGSDSVVTWVAPDFTCEIYITCTVEDIFHKTAKDSVFVQVKADSSGTG